MWLLFVAWCSLTFPLQAALKDGASIPRASFLQSVSLTNCFQLSLSSCESACLMVSLLTKMRQLQGLSLGELNLIDTMTWNWMVPLEV
jgi:hypothetical protein